LPHLDAAPRCRVGLAESPLGVTLDPFEPGVRDHWVRQIVERVVLALDRVEVMLSVAQIRACAHALDDPAF
jgi:hypothetical protein